MLAASTTPAPNFRVRADPELQRYGPPNMILMAGGIKFYVHASRCAVYSRILQKIVEAPDPVYGKMLVLRGKVGPCSPDALQAVLEAIYPPQKIPPDEVLVEVFQIARDYEMTLLLEKMKLGLANQRSLLPLIAAVNCASVGKNGVPRLGGVDVPRALYEAYAGFSMEELESLEGFGELDGR